MNRWHAGVVLCLVLLPAVQAADESRAVITRAIKAQGGEDNLLLQSATYLKLKGKASLSKEDNSVEVNVEVFKQSDGKSKSTFQIALGDTTIELVQLFTGKEGWQNQGHRWEKMSADELKTARDSAAIDRVVSLLPLLKEKGFTLAPLAETRVQGRHAVGVKVSAKDMPDLQLFFDKDTGLLCLYRYQAHDKERNKDVAHEVLLGEYKEVDFAARHETVLKKAGLDVSNAGLLAFLKKQTGNPELRKRVKTLIGQLAHDDFEAREKAAEELVSLGSAAVFALEAASRDTDPEVSRRAADCLKKIKEQSDPQLVKSALQLVGLRQPPGAAAVLLAFLASHEGALRQEAQAALWATTQPKGKLDPVLNQALSDPDPIRQAAAQAVLGQDGGVYLRQPGRRLAPPGLKQPMKLIVRLDNELFLDVEVVDIQLYNRFEDHLFARPD